MGIIVNQHQTESKTSQETSTQDEHISFWKVVLSVLQASFGVQSSKNRERDFTHGKVLPFVIAALIFTAIFVITIMLVVQMVLPDSA